MIQPSRTLLGLVVLFCTVSPCLADVLPVPVALTPEAIEPTRASAAATDHAFVADLSKSGAGSVVSGTVKTVLPVGRYRFHADLELAPVGDMKTSAIRIDAQAGEVHQPLNALAFVEPRTFTPVSIDFSVGAITRPTQIGVTYQFEGMMASQNQLKAKDGKVGHGPSDMDLSDKKGKDDMGDMMAGPLTERDGSSMLKDALEIPVRLVAKGLWIEALAPVGIEEISTDKITYNPDEKAEIRVVAKNYSNRPQHAVITVERITGFDQVKPVKTFEVDVGPVAKFEWKDTIGLTDVHYGAQIRATVKVGHFPSEVSGASFGVSRNFMELARYASNTGTLEYEDMSRARAKAKEWRDHGFTAFESFFWGPCDLLLYVPKEEHFFGGQTGYVGSVTGTKNLLAACKEQGIAGTFYANLWGGSGPYCLDVQRQHPEWFGISGFDTFVYDNYDMVYSGIARAPGIPWLNNQLYDPPPDEPFNIHAQQIIEAHKVFGWAGTRYDSYYATEWTKRATPMVRKIVEAEIPDYRWGFNAFADADDRVGALEGMVQGGGTVMSEGIARINGTMPLAGYADYMINTRDLIWSRGGHHGPIYSKPQPEKKKDAFLIPLDEVYMACVLVATGSHTYYGALESNIGDHMGFGLRYSQYVFDNTLRPIPDVEKRVSFGCDPNRLFKWKRLAKGGSDDATHHRVVLHLINCDAGYMIQGDPAMKVPPPLTDLPLSVTLPPGSKVTGAWSAHASPAVEGRALPVTMDGQTAKVTVPRVRFYEMVVIEFTGDKGMEAGQ